MRFKYILDWVFLVKSAECFEIFSSQTLEVLIQDA